MQANYDYYQHTKINNLKELVDLALNKYASKNAFSYSQDNIKMVKTYQDVYEDVIRVSSYLKEHFQNEHIALIGENSYNWIIIFLAIVLSGNVCVVLDKDLDKKEIGSLLKKSHTKIICYSAYYNAFIKDMKYHVLPIDDLDIYRINKTYDFCSDNDKDAVIFFTSGTTGANKAVVLTQKNMAMDIYGASSLFEPHGSVVSLLPFHHAFGFVTGILMPFYYGVEVYLNSSLKYAAKALKDNCPNTIFVVPAFVETFYRQIWKTVRLQKKEKLLKRSIKISNYLLKIHLDLRKILFKDILKEFGGSLEYVICGGANLDKKYVEWFRSIGISILNGYGITECSPVVSVNRNLYYKDGSVGQICRDVKVKIIEGEICVRGDIVMKGYYNDIKATKAVLKDNYFYTGDLGYIDEEGFLFITGRKKNIIILSNGENISPELIESNLLKDKGVEEVIVSEEDNKLIAYIYPVEEYLDDEEYFNNLIYNYNKDKPKNHQIAGVRLRNKEFIKNNNGKILRSKVKE